MVVDAVYLSVIYSAADGCAAPSRLCPNISNDWAETVATAGYGIQLGRSFGPEPDDYCYSARRLAARIREHCRLARLCFMVEESTDWEICAPPFSLVCFRACPNVREDTEAGYAARLDALNEAIMNNVNATGEMFLSHTRLHGALTLRLAIGNIRTTEAHVRRAWELLNEELAQLS